MRLVGRLVETASEGARLGSYEIVRKLARGGMAELFLARTVGPEGFAKLVVLKKILPNYASNQKFVRLFLDEAKLVAQMEHPHIAHVYDMGKAGNDYFFTMEFVHGQDVRTVWRRSAKMHKPFPVAQAVLIARSIANALHYAHERKGDDDGLLDIVHRDVSPQNILLSYDGAVKLVDFGVAKAATSTVKTRTGALKGKISYMSPEQARGAHVDRRSDVFSLGIVLWELLVGRRLYKAENDLATLQMIINSKPQPPSQVRADCPKGLDTIIIRALSANVADRYQTAEEMQVALDALAREQRYDQSDAAVRLMMQELFDPELKIWNDSQAQGQTLFDHVLAGQPTVILPAEGDLSDEDVEDYEVDDDDEADDSEADDSLLTSAPPTYEPPTYESLPPTTPRQAMFDEPSTLTNTDSFATKQMHIPMPTLQLSVPPPPSQPMRAMSEPSPQFGLGRVNTPQAFPVAPASWRRTEPTPVLQTSHENITKHVLIACSVLLAVIVLVAVAFGGGGDPTAAAKAPTGQMPAAKHKVEMTVSPSAP